MDKLVSIIVPVYNVEKYLNKCVDSIVGQTYKNLEIILVDDGSPDNCPAMCDEWAEKDARIKVIHKDNEGLAQARNSGYRMSEGEYVSFIDSDDWIEPDFIEVLAKSLDNGADIADCATRLCDENDNTLTIRGFNKDELVDRRRAFNLLLKEEGIYQTVWNKIYKRETIGGLIFPYGKYHEDDFWTWKVFLNTKDIFVSSKPMYNYVQRENSIINSSYSIKRLDELEARYEELKIFENDYELKILCLKNFLSALIYSMQMTLKFLDKEELSQSKKIIFSYMDKCRYDRHFYKNYSKKFRFWAVMFLKFPTLTACIRNVLKIGF